MPTYTELLLLCEQLEQACIALEMELEQERAKSAEYLDNWVTATDTAAYRNMLLMCKG